MKATVYRFVVALGAGTLCACSSVPPGPSVAVMPAPHKPFEVFEQDDLVCRQFAERQTGVDPGRHAQDQIASGAVAGAAIGAAAGALLGGGDGEDIGEGAGAGLLVGTLAGHEHAEHDEWRLQERYDIAYMQCMYAKGNQVPGYPLARVAPPPPR